MGSRSARPFAATVGALGLVVGLAACGSVQPADRIGSGTVHLQFATPNGDPGAVGEDLVQAIEEVSEGRMTVDVTPDYGDGAPDAEARLVQAVASGALDGGWPGTRAFAQGGIVGVKAIEAPMAITSHAALVELVTGPAAEQVRSALEGSGVVGLALVADRLRRPFSSQAPLVDPGDWSGVTFRSYNSPVQAATIEALGATPAVVTHTWHQHVADGTLRGGELPVESYLAMGLAPVAGNLPSNVVLWPLVPVLSVSQKRYDSLTPTQQDWLRRAAQDVTAASLERGTPQEQNDAAEQLCKKDVRLVTASDAQMTQLRQAVEPVRQALRDDRAEAALMRTVDEIAQRHPDPDILDVPASCGDPSTAPATSPPTDGAGIPDGIYRTAIPVSAVTASGDSNNDGWSGTWTLTIKDGTYALTCRPLDQPGRDCGNVVIDGALEAGHVRGAGDQVSFEYDAQLHSSLSSCQLPASRTDPGHCNAIDTYSATWTLAGDLLTFSDSDVLHLVLEPWRRIG